MRRLVVLGAGTAGTMVVNKLRRRLPARRLADHGRRPGRRAPLPAGLPVPAVRRATRRTSWSSRGTVHPGRCRAGRSARSTGSTPTANAVHARPTAARLGLRLPGHRHRHRAAAGPDARACSAAQWRRSIFDFYTLDGATALRDALARFDRRPARRARHRHADQVPGRAAGVRLPRRRLLRGARACATGSSWST